MQAHALTPLKRYASTSIYAHRGLAQTQAENTDLAFADALKAGADWIETDVNTTSDGAVVVFHDPTLDRLSDSVGAIKDMTWEQVRAVELKDGGTVPLLEGTLRAFPQARFNIDLKDAGSAERIIPVLLATGAQERVRVASFSERRLRQAHRAAQKAGISLSMSASQLAVSLFYLASRVAPGLWASLLPLIKHLFLPFDSLQIPLYYRLAGRNIRIADRALVEAAHRAGLEVHVWIVDDQRTMRELIALGVDGIVTNHTDVLARILGRSE
ncbi:glycerophosphodiester phosphodiesterase family protein [Rothia sp. P5764]|uniref:glycerophosphodiester phosphodiesterase family protein n=1 Tax=Rothia sp. P5764 TaxID=3402654 RepID=UPI003ABE858C